MRAVWEYGQPILGSQWLDTNVTGPGPGRDGVLRRDRDQPDRFTAGPVDLRPAGGGPARLLDVVAGRSEKVVARSARAARTGLVRYRAGLGAAVPARRPRWRVVVGTAAKKAGTSISPRYRIHGGWQPASSAGVVRAWGKAHAQSAWTSVEGTSGSWRANPSATRWIAAARSPSGSHRPVRRTPLRIVHRSCSRPPRSARTWRKPLHGLAGPVARCWKVPASGQSAKVGHLLPVTGSSRRTLPRQRRRPERRVRLDHQPARSTVAR